MRAESSKGRAVTKKVAKKRAWTKLELRRIGEITEVAGAQTPGSQAAGNTKS